ncbi:MAG: 4Fe-4S binding protein [Oscillospiraceae bacterium]|nr:4Fe-4S binding protein [Oscillospiraceae bacterium]
MKGITTPMARIRRRVFEEAARLGFEGGGLSRMDQVPYQIIPGEVALYRDSVFRERAVVGERLRMACGLPLRDTGEYAPISQGIERAAVCGRYVEGPLIQVIPFACNACDTHRFAVTDACQRCLEHPCVSACPVKAVSLGERRARIDTETCIRCGRCRDACPYHAILEVRRPCAAVCGVDAIQSDELGRAVIDQEKCVACGQCLSHCPFSAIADKSQVFQLALALREGKRVAAALAPSFVGQFGPLATPGRVKSALLALGFSQVVEVAMGADWSTDQEAREFLKHVGKDMPFLATSCCPSWSVMAKREFPELAGYVSLSLTPMVQAARRIREENPGTMVAFIGPCLAKKLEAGRESVRSDVDFVVTFEEMMGMFAAKEVDFAALSESEVLADATALGRGYAVAGGVAAALAKRIEMLEPGREVPIDRADTLSACKKLLMVARAGKRDGYLLEGMACPGGCIGGTGGMLPVKKAAGMVERFAQDSPRGWDDPKSPPVQPAE